MQAYSACTMSIPSCLQLLGFSYAHKEQDAGSNLKSRKQKKDACLRVPWDLCIQPGVMLLLGLMMQNTSVV